MDWSNHLSKNTLSSERLLLPGWKTKESIQTQNPILWLMQSSMMKNRKIVRNLEFKISKSLVSFPLNKVTSRQWWFLRRHKIIRFSIIIKVLFEKPKPKRSKVKIAILIFFFPDSNGKLNEALNSGIQIKKSNWKISINFQG